jgi:hypothetical protein
VVRGRVGVDVVSSVLEAVGTLNGGSQQTACTESLPEKVIPAASGALGRPLDVNIPRAVADVLFRESRYKVLYGGRGGAKSWGIAQYIVVRMAKSRTRVVCAREIQSSIKESVHRLISNQIEAMGFRDAFVITDTSIRCRMNGSEAIFAGLFRNVHNIKSLEDCDICWVEEAENVSEETWQKLIPTIRNESSEILVSFNTRYVEDPTYKRFVANPPENCITRLVNFPDNPYFPKVLNIEQKADRTRDLDTWEHIWMGKALLTGSRIWQPFDKAVHVREWSIKDLKDKANFFMSIDPHSAYYPAILWWAVFPKPNSHKVWPQDFYKYVHDEWPRYEDLGGYYSDLRKKLYYNGSLKDLAKIIYTKDGTAEHGITIRKRFVDTRYAKAAGAANWSTSTQGLVQEWAKPENGGIVCDMPAEKLLSSIRMVIVDEMQYNKFMPICDANEPSVFVSGNCKNLIQSLLNHRCVEASEKEDETYKDFSDSFRIGRAGIVDCHWRDPLKKVEASREYTYEGGDSLQWMAA